MKTKLLSGLLAFAILVAPLAAPLRAVRAEEGAKIIPPRFQAEVGVESLPSNGQALIYDTTKGKWIAGTVTGGAFPTGPAGGDLGGTYPNPTVLVLTHVTSGMSLQAAYNGGASGTASGAIALSLSGGPIALSNPNGTAQSVLTLTQANAGSSVVTMGLGSTPSVTAPFLLGAADAELWLVPGANQRLRIESSSSMAGGVFLVNANASATTTEAFIAQSVSPQVYGSFRAVCRVIDGAPLAQGQGGGIAFSGLSAVGYIQGGVSGWKENGTSGNSLSSIIWATNANAGASSNLTYQMRLDSAGALGIKNTGLVGFRQGDPTTAMWAAFSNPGGVASTIALGNGTQGDDTGTLTVSTVTRNATGTSLTVKTLDSGAATGALTIQSGDVSSAGAFASGNVILAAGNNGGAVVTPATLTIHGSDTPSGSGKNGGATTIRGGQANGAGGGISGALTASGGDGASAAGGAGTFRGGDGNTNGGGALVTVRGGNTTSKIDTAAGGIVFDMGTSTGTAATHTILIKGPALTAGSGSGTNASTTFAKWAGTNSAQNSNIYSLVLNATGASLSTTATDGFLYVGSSAGAPAGTPTTYTGATALTIDSTNSKLYFYSGGAWNSSINTIAPIVLESPNSVSQRNGANAQLTSFFNTYTSATSFEAHKIDWQTTANVCQVYNSVGSAGGTPRQLVLGGWTQVSDVAGQALLVRGDSAYAQASTNATGMNLVLAGGIGRRFYTVLTFGNLALKTATVTVNGTATTKTEGTDWTAATSNNATATSLAAALNSVSGVSAVAVGASVYVTPNSNTSALQVATNAAGGDMSTTAGSDGSITIGPTAGLAANFSGIVYAGDGVAPNVYLATYSATAGGSFVGGVKVRGSVAAPSGVLAGDALMNFGGAGYNGTTFTGSKAAVVFNAIENWSASANGTYITAQVTAAGSTSASSYFRVDPTTMAVRSDMAMAWGTNTTISGTAPTFDVRLARQNAAGILGLFQNTSGGAAQLRVYATTDNVTTPVNADWLEITTVAGGQKTIGTNKAGTGTQGALALNAGSSSLLLQTGGTSAITLDSSQNATFAANVTGPGAATFTIQSASNQTLLLTAGGTTGTINLRTNGVTQWQVLASGALVATTDNSYDIGASGATRPRDFYLGRDAIVTGNVKSSANGVSTLGTSNVGWKQLYSDYTINTTAGTTATINKMAGKVRMSSTNSTFTLTNSLVTANSIVMCMLETSDATATGIRRVTPTANTVTIVTTAAATGNVDISFVVISTD